MRAVFLFLTITMLSSLCFADSRVEELKHLKERVKYLEQEAEIKGLEDKINRLERGTKNKRMSKIQPFIGGSIGALGANKEINTGAIGGGVIGITGNYLGMSLNLLHYKKDNKVQTMSEGNIAITPLMFNLFGRIPLEDVAAIRFGGGASYILVTHKVDSELNALFAPFKLVEDIDSGVGFQVNGGIDFFFGGHFSFGADIFYIFYKPEGTFSIQNSAGTPLISATADVDLSTVVGVVTMKYHF